MGYKEPLLQYPISSFGVGVGGTLPERASQSTSLWLFEKLSESINDKIQAALPWVALDCNGELDAIKQAR